MLLYAFYFVSALSMDICFTALVPKRLPAFCHAAIMALYVLLGYILNIEHFATPLMIFLVSLLIYFNAEKRVVNIIFSICGYLIGTLTNHIITIPLSVAGISIDVISANYPILFVALWMLFTALILYLIRRCFLKKRYYLLEHCSSKMIYVLLFLLYVCILLMTVNFIYGEKMHYPIRVLTFNGIAISVFALSVSTIFYFLFCLFVENEKNALQLQNQLNLAAYPNQLDSYFKEMRTFRHDYKHILASMEYYIQNNDMAQLKEYFHDKILPTDAVLSNLSFSMSSLYLVENPALKSIIYAKMIYADQCGITPTLEIQESIPYISLDDITLCRIIGIIFDNCIEAAADTQEKLLKIALVSKSSGIYFIFENSTQPIMEPIETLSREGFTTKENHSGMGLSYIYDMTIKFKTLSYKSQYDKHFYQTLAIRKES